MFFLSHNTAETGASCVSVLTYWKWFHPVFFIPRLSSSIWPFLATDKPRSTVVGYKSKNITQITEDRVSPSTERIEMFSEGRGSKGCFFFLPFFFLKPVLLVTAAPPPPTSCQSDSTDSPWAQLWHYLLKVNKEKYVASTHDS